MNWYYLSKIRICKVSAYSYDHDEKSIKSEARTNKVSNDYLALKILYFISKWPEFLNSNVMNETVPFIKYPEAEAKYFCKICRIF